MSDRFAIVCEGVVTVTADGAPLCSGGWFTQPAVVPFEISQVDPHTAFLYFGLGFGIVSSLWITSRVIKALLDVLRHHLRI